MGPSKLTATGRPAAGSRLVNVVVETSAGSWDEFKFDEKVSVRDLPAVLLDETEHFVVASCR